MRISFVRCISTTSRNCHCQIKPHAHDRQPQQVADRKTEHRGGPMAWSECCGKQATPIGTTARRLPAAPISEESVCGGGNASNHFTRPPNRAATLLTSALVLAARACGSRSSPTRQASCRAREPEPGDSSADDGRQRTRPILSRIANIWPGGPFR